MPLTELDPNISGRNSRASGTSSARTRDSAKRYGGGRSDPLSATPGVRSMLRTTTEIGDVGSLALPPRINRFGQAYQRSSGRKSAGSTHSGPTNTRSHHHDWPSASSGPHRSVASDHTTVEELARKPSSVGARPLKTLSPRLPYGDRSSSPAMDMAMTPFALTNHRSMTSLRRHDTHARAASPLVYPTRLKRPGHRAPSPALSDITGMQYARPHPHMLAPPDRTQHVVSIGPARHDLRLPPPGGHGPGFGNGLHPARPSPPLREASSSAPPIMAPAPLRVRRTPLRAMPVATPGPHASRAPSTSPVTPDPTGSSLEVVAASANGIESITVTQPTSIGLQTDTGPVYYDYSESFHPGYPKPSAAMSFGPPRSPPAVPSGFVSRIRSLLEEYGHDPTSTSLSNGFPHLSALIELPGHSSLVELPADDVPEAIRKMRQAQAAHATAHAENLTMESIAHLITDVREQNDLDDAPRSNTSSPSRHANNEARQTMKKSKRLSVISEAASNITKSTNNSAAIDLAVRYSAAVVVDAPSSPVPAQPPHDEEGALDGQGATETDLISAKADQDETPRHSVDDTLEEPSTGSIKVATEVVFERKREELTLLEPRSTPERTKSLIVPLSTPSRPSSRRSAPSGRMEWPETDVEATSSDDTSTDVAVHITMPSISAAAKSEVVDPSMVNTPVMVDVDVTETDVKSVVVNITQATDTVETAPPVSPMVDNSVVHKDGPVSPLTTTMVKLSPPPSQRASLIESDRVEAAASNRKQPTGHRILKTASRATDSSSSIIKDVLAQYSDALDMSTTDLRFSQLRHTSVTSKPLPNLQEEAVEDSTIADFRISNFKFPKPGQTRRSSLDSAIGRISKESTRSVRTSGVVRAYSTALAEVRSIPSLQFSSSNLIEKLNSALGHRHGGNLGTLQLGDSPKAKRNLSDIRERYKSFFASLDDIDHPSTKLPKGGEKAPESLLLPEDPTDSPRTPDQALAELQPADPGDNTVPPSKRPSIHILQRPSSPQDIIDEVNRLVVPEVSSLTQRLSDLIPSLRRFLSTEITKDGSVELTLNEIRTLGRRRIVRADGRVISLVKEDSWVLPDHLPPDDQQSLRSASPRSDSKRDSVVDGPRRSQCDNALGDLKFTILAEPRTSPSREIIKSSLPLVNRGRSLTDSYGVIQSSSKLHLDHNALSVSTAPIEAQRSASASPSADERPWLMEYNYHTWKPDVGPWLLPPFDPSYTPPRLRHAVSAQELRFEKHAQRTAAYYQQIVDDAIKERARARDDSYIKPSHSIKRSRGCGPLPPEARHIVDKKDISLPMKMTTANANWTLGADLRLPSDCIELGRVSSTTPMPMSRYTLMPLSPVTPMPLTSTTATPGDRYPTTSLTPPNIFDLDEVTSHFSDDTEDLEKEGLAARFARLRSGMRNKARSFKPSDRKLPPGGDTTLLTHGHLNDLNTQDKNTKRYGRYLEVPVDYHRSVAPIEAHNNSVQATLTTGDDGSKAKGMANGEFRKKKSMNRVKKCLHKGAKLWKKTGLGGPHIVEITEMGPLPRKR